MEEAEKEEMEKNKKGSDTVPPPPEPLPGGEASPPPSSPLKLNLETNESLKGRETPPSEEEIPPPPPPPEDLTLPLPQEIISPPEEQPPSLHGDEIPPPPGELEVEPQEGEEEKEHPRDLPETTESPEKGLELLKTEEPLMEKKIRTEVMEELEGVRGSGEEGHGGVAEEVKAEEGPEKVEEEREEGEGKEVVEGEKQQKFAFKLNIRTIFSPLTKIAEAIGKRKRTLSPDIGGTEGLERVVRPKKVPRIALESLPPSNWELLREYDVSSGVAKVRIYLDPETSNYIYWVIEPPLTEEERETLERIKKLLQIALPYSIEAVEDEKRGEYLLEHFQKVVNDYRIKVSEKSVEKLKYYVSRDFLGYNRIDPIMHDPNVEDVSCDGPEIPIYLYHRDYGSIKTNVVFESDEVLDGFVVSLAQKCRKTISVANPILDATLPDGSRLNATYGREITTRGSSFTIRKFREEPLTVVDLVENNTMSDEMAAHFWLAVQYGESMIFAGGTASGKTSTMNAISIFIPPSSKIISIEDTREVNLPHENWIAGITRGGAEAERPGDIGMYDLLRAALRQRPEYVIVGEVRGKETMTMFQAMATGHTTYSTMHADSVKSIVYRLENPPIGIPRVLIQALNLVAIHKQIKVKDKRVRRITELVEIVDIEPTTMEVVTNQVFRWNPRTDTFIYGGHSNLYEKIMDLEDMSREEVLEERDQRAEVIRWMVRNGVRKFWDVARVVAEYYEDSERTLSIIRKNPEVLGNPLEVFEKREKKGVGIGKKATEAPA